MNSDPGYVVTTSPRSAQLFLCECRSTPGLTLVQNLEDNRFHCRYMQGTRALFAQHRFLATVAIPIPNPESPGSVYEVLQAKLNWSALEGKNYSTQVAASWALGWGGEELQQRLTQQPGTPTKAHEAEKTVSVYIHRWCESHTLYAGICDIEDNLSRWPVGQFDLEAESGNVSPRELAFLETQSLHQFPDSGEALDLGAAPGGWSRLLAQRGLTVDAVDPEPLEPGVESLDKVTQHTVSAEQFLESAQDKYDLIVCDMETGSGPAFQTLLKAHPLLKPGGQAMAILRLRKGPTALAEARKAVALLGQSYRIDQVRQLHSTGRELTLLMS